MKKYLFLLAVAVMFSFNAYAKHADKHCPYMGGGFVDASVATMSIADILKHKPDDYVTMQGYITKRLGEDTYNFTDGKDNITLEIDDKYWRGQTVSPKDMVNVSGELEKEDGRMVVDVKSLHLIEK